MPPEILSTDSLGLLAAYYLGNQDLVTPLRAVIDFAWKYLAGHRPEGEAGLRQSQFNQAQKHAQGLMRLLRQIDHGAIALAMQPMTPITVNQPPGTKAIPATAVGPAGSSIAFHRAEVAYSMDLLERLSHGLKLAASQEKPVRHRPKTADPIVFAIKALAGLWIQAGRPRPTANFKKQQFGEFVMTMLGPKGLGCGEATVRTAIRHYVAESKKPQSSPDTPSAG